MAIGKHGCAIIGSSAQNSFEMILYKEKRNVIMRAKIGAEFAISVKKDDFASFYDSAKENWLVKFSNNDDCVAVLTQVEKCGGKVVSEDTKKVVNEKPQSEKSEEDSTPENKARSDILTRIAKMGQSILPSKASDTSEEVVETVDTKVSGLSKSRDFSSVSSSSSSTILTPANIIHSERSMPTVPNTVVITQPMGYDPLNVYVSENRAHNSELRMNLSQISEKLNCIMKLVDSEKTSNKPDDVSKSKIKVLELRVENLVRELDTIQQENAKLKLERNHQNTALKREQELETELKNLQEHKNAKIEELERQILLSESKVVELCQVSETQKTETDELRKQLASYQEESSEVPNLKQTILELEQKLIECELNREKQTTDEDKEKTASFTSMLKEEMNGMYADIVANFNKDQNISEINNIIAQNIKLTTLKIIQNFQILYHT